MKVRDVMTQRPIHIHKDETVAVAARTLTHYNIGVVPVRGRGGALCGMLTDRDIVTRCLAAGRMPENTRVREIMTPKVYSVTPDMDASLAAHMMGRLQIRRLPVLENEKLCGMVSLGDLTMEEEASAARALTQISSNIRPE